MSAIADLIGDPATPDDALARAAASAPAGELEALLRDEARLLRHPAIVAALFANPQAPMAMVNRAVAVCVRGGVRVEAIPGFDDVAAGVRAEVEGGAGAAGAFEQVMAESAAAGDGPHTDADADTGADTDGKAGAEQGMGGRKRRAAVIDFGKLKLFEKIRLATLGNSFCRQTLLRDSNRLVAMAAIRSPGITEQEVIRAAGNRAVSET
jgi:hypothetical protein